MVPYQIDHYRWPRITIVVLVCSLVMMLYGLHATRPGLAASRADVAVAIWPTPSVQVASGHLLVYEVRVKNFGAGRATQVEVNLPYDPQTLTVENAYFSDKSSWVSELDPASIEVTFLNLDEDDTRLGTISFRVASNVPENTVINMWAGFSWENDRADEEGRLSNAAPVVVGSSDISNPHITLLVDPIRGTADTVYSFFSDRFAPNEEMRAWLNTPGLPEAIDLNATTDSRGRIWVRLVSPHLSPGPYSLVLYGSRSELTGVGAFIVEPVEALEPAPYPIDP